LARAIESPNFRTSVASQRSRFHIGEGSGPDVKPDVVIVGVCSSFNYRDLRDDSEQAFFPMFEGEDAGALTELIQKADGLDLARAKTPWPFKWIKMPLGALLTHMTTHDRRHLYFRYVEGLSVMRTIYPERQGRPFRIS
jgi:hypothetical protein